MVGFINLLISLVPSPLRSPARWIANRILSVFVDGVRFAKWIRSGFVYFEARVILYAVSLSQSAGHITATFYWLAKWQLPRSVNNAVTSLRTYMLSKLSYEIGRVKTFIVSAVDTLWNSVRVFRALYDLTIAWIKNKLSGVIDLLSRVVDRLFGVLGTPQRMVEWIIGALWGAIFRYLYAHRDRIVSWVLRSSGAFSVWLARELERILVRLL